MHISVDNDNWSWKNPYKASSDVLIVNQGGA